MDGLLVVDKPSGPTSHDIVARARRALRERRIGHTGTLDPMASGVLPLLIGRATRLARFIGGDKVYEASIRLGVSTDTYDALGQPAALTFAGPWPSHDRVDAALDRFRGTFLQRPPAFSAKKIAGRRSYELARRLASATPTDAAVALQEAPTPSPAPVTAHAIELIEAGGDLVRVRVHSSAGFYIRSLAHDLGEALGTGAHLVQLRRTAAAGAQLSEAIRLDVIDGNGGSDAAHAALIPMDRMLSELPSVRLTDEGMAHARVGRTLGPADAAEGYQDGITAVYGPAPRFVRLLAPSGDLVAVGGTSSPPGLLHPAVVLI